MVKPLLLCLVKQCQVSLGWVEKSSRLRQGREVLCGDRRETHGWKQYKYNTTQHNLVQLVISACVIGSCCSGKFSCLC